MNMRSVIYTVILSIFSIALVACSTNLVSSNRAPGVNLTAQGLRIVFEDASFKVSSTTSHLNADGRIKHENILFGHAVMETLPAVLAENKMPASSRTLSSQLLPPNQDFSAFFPEEQRMWHTLIVTPVRVSGLCQYSSCDIVVRASLRLIDPKDFRVVWSAIVEQPTFDLPAGSRQELHNRYARDIAKILLAEIRKAGSS